jgi:hypothetical protein
MSLSSTIVANAAFVATILVLFVVTLIYHVSNLIACITSSCCNLSLVSCLLEILASIAQVAYFVALDASFRFIHLELVCQLARGLFLGHLTLVGPTLVWTHISHVPICPATIA